jgi:hypothetical protein
MHFVDIYWIVFPTLYEHGFHFSWIDAGTMMGIGGIFLWYFGSKYFKNAMVPVNDPKLQESINFVN